MSVKPQVVFRVDESSRVGFGHMSRCRALAEALVKEGADVCFWTRSVRPTTRSALESFGVKIVDLSDEQTFLEQDWHSSVVVVDGYHFDADFWQELESAGVGRTVHIDDFRAIPYRADIVVCYNEGLEAEQFNLAPHTRLFLGGRFLMLRNEILCATRLVNSLVPRRALMIASGGTRQEPWVAAMLTQLSCIEPHLPLWVLSGRRLSEGIVLHRAGLSRSRVRFFSGLAANDMIRLYRQARYLLAPSSTVMLEAFSAGCPIVSGWVADNQRNSLDFYDRQGLLVNLGDVRKVSRAKLTWAFTKAKRQSGPMARRQRAYIQDSTSGVDEIVKAVLASI